MSNQTGYTQVPYTSNVNASSKSNSARQDSGSESVQTAHIRQESYTGQSHKSQVPSSSSTQPQSNGNRSQSKHDHSPKDSECGEENDKLVELSSKGKTANQYFDRNKSANMSLRKAYGIFDEISFHDKPKMFSHNSRRRYDPGEIRETKIIAEKARKDWERSGKFESQESGKLKRTTSEQLRPLRENMKEQQSHKGMEQSPGKPKETNLRRQNATDKPSPSSEGYPDYLHRLSDPKDAQKAQDFLCNSPLSRQRRMFSDSDNVYQPSIAGTRQAGKVSHVRQSSNRSASSCSSMDDQSRHSDAELRKIHEGMLTSPVPDIWIIKFRCQNPHFLDCYHQGFVWKSCPYF